MKKIERKAQIDNLVNQIDKMSDSQLVQLNNAYCQEMNASEDEIYNNDEDFFETFFAGKPHQVAMAIGFGNYEFGADWVRFNGYGNLESIRFMTREHLFDSPESIAEYALDNQDAFAGILNFNFNNNFYNLKSILNF